MSIFVPEPQHEQIRKRYHEVPWRKAVDLIGSLLLSLVMGVGLARLALGVFSFFDPSRRPGAVIGAALILVVAPLLLGWLLHKRRKRLEAAFQDDADGQQG